MTRFALTNLIGAAALGAALLFAPAPRWPWAASAFLVWHAVIAWGVVRLDSGFFVRAVCKAPSSSAGALRRAVALSFDDGPDPEVTPKLLDVLAERGVPAAFFAIGERVASAREVARRCVDEGHLVENHSQRHLLWNNFLFTRAMTDEIAACSREIETATGAPPTLYRPPFGFTNHATAEAARRNGLQVVGWQIRGFDNPGADPDAVVQRVLDGIEPGGVILLHDGGRRPEAVVEIVTRILDGLQERQLTVERVDRLLGLTTPVPTP